MSNAIDGADIHGYGRAERPDKAAIQPPIEHVYVIINAYARLVCPLSFILVHRVVVVMCELRQLAQFIQLPPSLAVSVSTSLYPLCAKGFARSQSYSRELDEPVVPRSDKRRRL